MKNNLHKWLALIMACMMVVGLIAGCAAPASSGGSASPSESTAGETEAVDPSVEEELGELAKYRVGDPDNPIEMTIYFNHTWYGTEKWEGIIPEEIQRITGIKLNCIRTTDYSQLGVMASSGDLPDLVFTSQQMGLLSDPDISYSYDELIAQYCPDWKPDNALIVNASRYSSDDHYYFLFSHTVTNRMWREAENGVPMVATVLYRKDILDELGLEKPETIEELFDVYEAVKQAHPEMTPLTFETSTWSLQVFKPYSGCTLQHFLMESPDDECKIVEKLPMYKQYLKNCNYMYQQGYINADCWSWNSAQNTASFASGNSFSIVAGTQNGLGDYIALADVAPNYQIDQLGELGDYPIIESEIGWSATFITKNCKNPEAAIKLMEFLFSDYGMTLSQWGREGIDYVLDENGLPQFSEDWIKSKQEGTHNQKYNTLFYLGGSKILESVERVAAQPEWFASSNASLKDAYRNEPWYYYCRPNESDGDIKALFDKYNDAVTNGQVKVILSENDEEFEKNYQEFVDTLDQIGCDEIAEWIQPKIAEAMVLFADSM